MDKIKELKNELEGHIEFEENRLDKPKNFTEGEHEAFVLGLRQALSIINEIHE